ncbi:MAG: MBL fold metallo-hydrolase [Candidatus Nanopelagicales bacterium]|jgi:glyoxylase-like metal-dependent hydrolase (beta-lactamase superfamily II)|nr:MBL fold metallo-hydrolase [Candidatus Nanopelagicales bacterium]
MLIAGFPAGPFGTNCWILAPGAHSEAVIIDPGMDSRRGIEQVVAEHGLRPVAVILTHGHLDHMWSVLPVCDGYDIPAWIHPGDRSLLADPWAGVSGETRMMFASVVGATDFAEPSEVRELTDGQSLEIAGMTFTADHAPGHTPGSTAFRMLQTGADPLMVSGDLLFAGSIGRTDLPGGDHAAMLASLARVVLTQPDDMLVLPGHGETTTIGAERRMNPFLQGLVAPDPPRAPR